MYVTDDIIFLYIRNQTDIQNDSKPMHRKNSELRRIDRTISSLALPSLATLLAEPLLIMVDSAMVGRLGTSSLAGLSLSSTILTAIVGICIFLTYATTAETARFVGAGNHRAAIRRGIDGIWLGGMIGVIFACAFHFGAQSILRLFGPQPQTLEQAVAYAQSSAFGLPGMLVTLAATGTLRGFSDAKSPLYASVAGSLLNIPLNFFLIYPCALKISGAGYGTAAAQLFMAFFLCMRVRKIGRRYGVPPFPKGAGVLLSLRSAIPLIIRTLCLRGAILLQITAAAGLGTVALAGNQIAMTMWNFASYGLDSLATAAQIMIGQSLGRGNVSEIRTILRRCINRSVVTGIILALFFAVLSFAVPSLITADSDVRTLSVYICLIISLSVPVSALAYLLDGVLIGAGDTRKLAKYMLISFFSFTPVALAVLFLPMGSPTFAMLFLWAGYALVFMTARSATAYCRVRGAGWMHLHQPGD